MVPKQGLGLLKTRIRCVLQMLPLSVRHQSNNKVSSKVIGRVPPIWLLKSFPQADTYAEVAEKVEEWLAAGCRMVWVINPRRETVEVYRPNADFTILRGTDTLDGSDVVEGFRCPVQAIFV